MQDRPVIKIAIPKRRYQIGDYGASLLGEIESGDARSYLYILALVQTGKAQPSFYACVEQMHPTGAEDGRYGLRVVTDVMSEIVDTDERWGDLDTFVAQGLKLGAQALGLLGEQVVRLM